VYLFFCNITCSIISTTCIYFSILCKCCIKFFLRLKNEIITHWLTDSFTDSSADSLTGWLTDWLTHSIYQSISQSINQSIDQSINQKLLSFIILTQSPVGKVVDNYMVSSYYTCRFAWSHYADISEPVGSRYMSGVSNGPPLIGDGKYAESNDWHFDCCFALSTDLAPEISSQQKKTPSPPHPHFLPSRAGHVTQKLFQFSVVLLSFSAFEIFKLRQKREKNNTKKQPTNKKKESS
jgi:hypothetical protein